MTKLTELVLHNSWSDYSEEIEQLIFWADRLRELYKINWRLKKDDMYQLFLALNIIEIAWR